MSRVDAQGSPEDPERTDVGEPESTLEDAIEDVEDTPPGGVIAYDLAPFDRTKGPLRPSEFVEEVADTFKKIFPTAIRDAGVFFRGKALREHEQNQEIAARSFKTITEAAAIQAEQERASRAQDHQETIASEEQRNRSRLEERKSILDAIEKIENGLLKLLEANAPRATLKRYERLLNSLVLRLEEI